MRSLCVVRVDEPPKPAASAGRTATTETAVGKPGSRSLSLYIRSVIMYDVCLKLFFEPSPFPATGRTVG
jgi:hypothetical protein